MSHMKLYDYWSEEETRPKPKLVINNKIKEIRADFFLRSWLFFFEGIGWRSRKPGILHRVSP